MLPRSGSQPGRAQIPFSNSPILRDVRRGVSVAPPLVPPRILTQQQRTPVSPRPFLQSPRQLFDRAPSTAILNQNPRNVYDLILRKGLDFYNFDEDIDCIFSAFSLPSWMSNYYSISILTKSRGADGILCYETQIKVTTRENAPKTMFYFFEVQKDVPNRRVIYYIQTQRSPFQSVNKVVVEGKIDLFNEFLVVKIFDFQGFFKDSFERPRVELFEFATQSHRLNQIEYPYIEPKDTATIEDNEEHYFVMLRGGSAKSSTYLGAYRAILDIFPSFSKKLRSIISSSTSSLIGLAIAAGEAPDYISYLLTELSSVGQKDRGIQSSAEASLQNPYFESVKQKVKEVFNDYGLMQYELFDLLHQTVFSKQAVIEKLMTAIAGGNITLQEAFLIDSNATDYYPLSSPTISSCTHLVTVQTNRPSMLNYYGLLNGYLLKGEYIMVLAEQVVHRLLLRKMKEEPERLAQAMQVNRSVVDDLFLRQIGRKLTMKQLYDIMGELEFTVVALDLDSRILRYLNHKTTPFLPVVHGIQIAFALPFLVKLPRWKKEWGKYYYHFRNRRKQLDLTGHTLLDGTVMDSSPLMYLQNQRIRQTFFARKPNNMSKIMSFETTFMENEVPKNTSREELFMELMQIIKIEAPVAEVYRITKIPPPPEFFPFESLSKPTDIPIVGLLTQLQSALKMSNDNIVSEIFSVRSLYFPENYTFAEFLVCNKTAYEMDQRYRSFMALRDSVYELKDALFASNFNRNSIVKVLEEIIQKLQLPTYQQDPRYIMRIKSTVLQQISSHTMYREDQKKRSTVARISGGWELPAYEQTMREMETKLAGVLQDVKSVYRFGYFYRERFMIQDAKNLQSVIRKLLEIYTIDQRAAPQLRPHLQMHLENFFLLRKLEEYNQVNALARFLDRYLLDIENGHFNVYHPHLYNLNALYSFFRFEAFPEFIEFSERLEELQEPFIAQHRAFERQREQTKFYINNTLRRRTNNNLHIVFQSQGFHAKYLTASYKSILEAIVNDHYQATDQMYEELARVIIQQNQEIARQKSIFSDKFTVEDLVKFIVVRADLNDEIRKIMGTIEMSPMPREIDLGYVKYEISEDLELTLIRIFRSHFENTCQVKAITTSGFASFFAFLLAADVDEGVVEEEIWSFKKHFVIDEDEIFRDYQSQNWVLRDELLVRDLQDLIWATRYDVWNNMQEAATRFRIRLDIERIKLQFQESRDPIMRGYAEVMNHVIRTAHLSNQVPPSSNPTSYFARMNSLRLNNYEDYLTLNQEISGETKRMVGMLMMFFQEQLRVVTMHLALPKIQQMIEMEEDPIKKEAIWRGVIITHFLKADLYRRHIRSTLHRNNMPPDIKLKEFYDVTPRKIDLTVNGIDFTQGKYVFINRYTFPEMPLWAALVIGASYPLIFPEVASRKSWLYHISLENTQLSRRLFFNEVPEIERMAPTFGSGDLVDTFPLSLLTNPMVLKSSFNDMDYTFVTLGIRSAPPRSHKMLGFYCRRFLDMYQIRQLFSGPSKVPYINQLSRVIMKHGNVLNNYVTSHDNLINELYSSEIILLPTRIGLLEYFRLTPSDRLNQLTLEQAYFSTHEKFSSRRKHCFIEIIYSQYTVEVYFISKDRFRNDIFTDYNVYFKFSRTGVYDLIPNGYRITFNLLQFKAIYVKFGFIRDQNLDIYESQFVIDLQTLFNFVRLDAVYMLPYSEFFNRLVIPFRVYHKVLKPPSRNQFGDQIVIRSMIDVTKNGLFCEVCCSPLVLNKLIFFPEKGRRKCLNCKRIRPAKYICPTPNCIGAYCLSCLKDVVFEKHPNGMTCNLNHQLVFKGSNRSKQPSTYIQCECCLQPDSFYYEDTACDITICHKCFSEINIDTEIAYD